MSILNRRDFLRVAGLGAGLQFMPASIQRALALPAHNRSGTIDDVEHVVILMQENRSFDHYFGTMKGVRGFGDRFTIPLPDGASVWQQSNGQRVVLPYYLDSARGNAVGEGGPHSWDDAHQAWDEGRMSHWPVAKSDVSMGYLKQTDLEFHFALADAFTICDAYHCSLHGGTNSNRVFLWAGSNQGPSLSSAGTPVAIINNDGWDTLDGTPLEHSLTWTTYPERLEAAGIRWKVYQNLPDNYTDNPLSGFLAYRQAYRAVNGNLGSYASITAGPSVPWSPLVDRIEPLYKGIGNTMPADHGAGLSEFRADVLSGRLPQVSWIVGPKMFTEHPDGTPAQGAYYIQQLLDILTQDAEVWSKTVLIVNYDENDCYFDHMPPPNPPSRNADGSFAGGSTVDTQQDYFSVPIAPGALPHASDGRPYGSGPRVPMLVISPWTRGGWVNSQVFDHTSVLRFLERRFGVRETNISPWRRAMFGDLTSVFDFVTPNVQPPRLPRQGLLGAELQYLRQSGAGPVPVPAVDVQKPPEQAQGLRPSRALPYELHVDAHPSAETDDITLGFRNAGAAGAVLHVYDRLKSTLIPRRYSVEAGRRASGAWRNLGDAGAYDLWVLGPNGYHRLLRGTRTTRDLEVEIRYDPSTTAIDVDLVNAGRDEAVFIVTASTYSGNGPTRHVVAPRGRQSLRLDLVATGGWYDLTVSATGGFTRRAAGRLETGRDSVSDPAMATISQASPFVFPERKALPPGVLVSSEIITLAGFSQYLPISITTAGGAEFSLDGGPFSTRAPNVCAGQTLQLRQRTASTPNTATRSTITVGDYSTAFVTITR